MHPNYLYIETYCIIAHKAFQNLCQMSILNTFLKSQICTQTLAPPENYVQKKTKQIIPVQHLINNTVFHQCILIKCLYFLRYCLICAVKYKFNDPINWNFWPQNTKNAHLTNSWLMQYLTPPPLPPPPPPPWPNGWLGSLWPKKFFCLEFDADSKNKGFFPHPLPLCQVQSVWERYKCFTKGSTGWSKIQMSDKGTNRWWKVQLVRERSKLSEKVVWERYTNGQRKVQMVIERSKCFKKGTNGERDAGSWKMVCTLPHPHPYYFRVSWGHLKKFLV